MKITSVFYWLFITAIIMMACNKRDLVGKDEYKQFKDWLSINGLAYKEGKVTQIGADGKIQHLKLDWSNTSSYKIDGIDYTEVRFVNSNSGNDDLKSATNIFNSSESDDVSVSLVFRTRFGKIEGALKFEEEQANVKKDGKEVPGALEFFYDVNSNFINAWFYEKETKELKFLKNIVVNDISTMQAGSQNIVQGDPGCMVYSVKYTTPCPSVIGPPTPGTDLDEVAVCVHVGYRHFQVCSGGGASGGGNPGGGGTGGPGIGFIPVSSQDTTWPSKYGTGLAGSHNNGTPRPKPGPYEVSYYDYNRTDSDFETGDDDNNPDGNYDNIIYSDYDNQAQPWPKIQNVIPISDFVGWNRRLHPEWECMDYAKAQIAKKGYSISNYFASGQTIQIYTAANGINISAAKNAVGYLISALQRGIPVIVGVDNKAGSPNQKTDKTTDHFIVIVGTGSDTDGRTYFSFYDNSSGNAIQGANRDNKLYYNSSTGMITGKSQTDYANNPLHYDYIVTQIRKSK